jgi:hypothetical protein
MFLPILPDVLPRLISVKRFPHVECIFATTLILARRIVAVVVNNASKDAVAHLAVHVYGEVVAGADVKVDEPRVGLVAGALELLGEETGVAEAPILGRDGEDCDVAMPGEGVGRGGEVGWSRFEFAHYCCQRGNVRAGYRRRGRRGSGVVL